MPHMSPELQSSITRSYAQCIMLGIINTFNNQTNSKDEAVFPRQLKSPNLSILVDAGDVTINVGFNVRIQIFFQGVDNSQVSSKHKSVAMRNSVKMSLSLMEKRRGPSSLLWMVAGLSSQVVLPILAYYLWLVKRICVQRSRESLIS